MKDIVVSQAHDELKKSAERTAEKAEKGLEVPLYALQWHPGL